LEKIYANVLGSEEARHAEDPSLIDALASSLQCIDNIAGFFQHLPQGHGSSPSLLRQDDRAALSRFNDQLDAEVGNLTLLASVRSALTTATLKADLQCCQTGIQELKDTVEQVAVLCASRDQVVLEPVSHVVHDRVRKELRAFELLLVLVSIVFLGQRGCEVPHSARMKQPIGTSASRFLSLTSDSERGAISSDL